MGRAIELIKERFAGMSLKGLELTLEAIFLKRCRREHKSLLLAVGLAEIKRRDEDRARFWLASFKMTEQCVRDILKKHSTVA